MEKKLIEQIDEKVKTLKAMGCAIWCKEKEDGSDFYIGIQSAQQYITLNAYVSTCNNIETQIDLLNNILENLKYIIETKHLPEWVKNKSDLSAAEFQLFKKEQED